METHLLLLGFLVVLSSTSISLAADETNCPELDCMEPCKYGFQKDEHGCMSCNCLDAECQGFQCEEGKDCRVFAHTVSEDRIPKCTDLSLPGACTPPNDMGPCKGRFIKWFFDSDSNSCQEFTYGGCKGNFNRFEHRDQCEKLCIKGCSPVSCYMHCEHGFMEGEDGCDVCKCRTEPKYIEEGVNVESSVFKISPGCDTASETECDLPCPYGYNKDEDGCNICQCLPPAHCKALTCDVTCEHGHREDVNQCPTCECREKGECSKIDCYMHCPFGRKLDTYGCPLCECKEDPCDMVDCDNGKQCRVVNGTTECVALVPQWLEGCPSIMCAMYCEHGYLSDRFGCNVCQCRTKPSPECPVMKCVACEPYFGYVFTQLGCRTCECHADPCLNHKCENYGLDVCVLEQQCFSCPIRPVCVPMRKVRRVGVHMRLTYLELPQDFNMESFSADIKKQLSTHLNIAENYISSFKVSQPSANTMNVDFHLVDDNGDPTELHNAVSELKVAKQYEFGQTSFSSDPTAYSAAYYISAGEPGNTGEAKQGQTAYIIIGCVVGGLVALMIGVVVALVITKGKKKGPRPGRKHNVIYQPTTYDDTA